MPLLDIELIWTYGARFHYVTAEVLNALLLDEPAAEIGTELFDLRLLGKSLLTKLGTLMNHRVLFNAPSYPIFAKLCCIFFELRGLDIGKKEV